MHLPAAFLTLTLASLHAVATDPPSLGWTYDINTVTQSSQLENHKGSILRDDSECVIRANDAKTLTSKEYNGLSVAEYARALNLEAGIAEDIPAFSARVKSYLSGTLAYVGHPVPSDLFFYRLDYVRSFTLYTLDLACLPGKLNHALLNDARRLPTTYNFAEYNQFMEKWGTHLTVEQGYGALISVQSVQETNGFIDQFNKIAHASALFAPLSPRPINSGLDLFLEVNGKSAPIFTSFDGHIIPSTGSVEDARNEATVMDEAIYHAKYATIASVLAKYVYPFVDGPDRALRRDNFVRFFDTAIVERGKRVWQQDFPLMAWNTHSDDIRLNNVYKHCHFENLCLAYNPTLKRLELRRKNCEKFRLHETPGAIQIQDYGLGFLTFNEGRNEVSFKSMNTLTPQLGLFETTQSGYIRTKTRRGEKPLYLMFQIPTYEAVLSPRQDDNRRLLKLICSSGGLATVLA